MKPDKHYPWATTDGATQVITIDGVQQTVPNKTQPVLEWRQQGQLYDKGMPIQYWNYQLNGYYLFLLHLEERLSIGDVYDTTEDLTQSIIEDRLGGTWTLLDTNIVGAKTTYYWEKEA